MYTVIHYVWNPSEDLLKLEQIQYELHLLHTFDEILLYTVIFCCEILPYISTSYRIIKMEQMEWSHYQTDCKALYHSMNNTTKILKLATMQSSKKGVAIYVLKTHSSPPYGIIRVL